jgi:hypothetical protein
MTDLQINTRNQVQDLLRIFSSSEAQAAYEHSMPGFVNPTVELFCCWDGAYYPHARSWFRETFSEDELDALRRFHSVYDAACAMRPKRPLLLTEYFKCLHGRRLMEAATSALNAFLSNASAEPDRNA